jgi:hypothetical protein
MSDLTRHPSHVVSRDVLVEHDILRATGDWRRAMVEDAGPVGPRACHDLVHALRQLEIAGEEFHLPALVGADFLARSATAWAGSLFAAQLVDARIDGKVFEVGKMALAFCAA